MKISVNIPTYKRAGALDTFRTFKAATYWVHASEVAEYKEKNQGIKIRTLPDKLKKNVAAVRNFILRSELKNNDVTVMMDDDINHFGYWEKQKRIKIKTEAQMLGLIEKYSRVAKEWGVKLWGVNINSDKQSYSEFTPFSTLVYISASFSCFLKGNECFYDERFSLKEDYDMAVQQLNKYRQVLRVNKIYYEKKSVEQIGGCSTYRSVDREMEQIKLLQKKWGTAIIRVDRNDERSHNLRRRKKITDINPVIKVPIKGI